MVRIAGEVLGFPRYLKLPQHGDRVRQVGTGLRDLRIEARISSRLLLTRVMTVRISAIVVDRISAYSCQVMVLFPNLLGRSVRPIF